MFSKSSRKDECLEGSEREIFPGDRGYAYQS